MNADELLNKYPDILKTYPAVGEGWYWILDNMLELLQQDIKLNNSPKINITDIKEKFGRLTIYFDNCNNYQMGVISLATKLSFSVCEECGSNKNIGHTQPWIKTLCQNCYLNSDRYYSNWEPTLFDDNL